MYRSAAGLGAAPLIGIGKMKTLLPKTKATVKPPAPVVVPLKPSGLLAKSVASTFTVTPMNPVVNVPSIEITTTPLIIKSDSAAAAALGTKKSTTEIIAASQPRISTPAPGSAASVLVNVIETKPVLNVPPPVIATKPLISTPAPLAVASAPAAVSTTPVTTSASQEADIKKLLATFPDVLDQAIADYAKLKAGLAYSLKNQTQLFTADQLNTITAWFVKFPDLWDTLAPNYEGSTGDATADQYRASVKAKAEAFVRKLRSDTVINPGLGVLPFIIIAGVIIAGLLGVGAAIWAIGYVQQQRNVSAMIDGVVAGKIPADVLDQAITQEQTNTVGQIGDILKYAVIAGALVLLWPMLSNLFSKAGKKA